MELEEVRGVGEQERDGDTITDRGPTKDDWSKPSLWNSSTEMLSQEEPPPRTVVQVQ